MSKTSSLRCGFGLYSLARFRHPLGGTILACICLSVPTVAEQAENPTSRAEMLLRRLYDGQSNYVMVAAHRGDWRNEPENSLPAIERAIAMGVDIVEIDVQTTRDGHLVLMHDKTLDRTTTGTGKVLHHTLAEIKALHLKNGYGMSTDHRVPTLADALYIAKDRLLVYVDKSPEIILAVDAVARETGASEQVLYYGHYSAAELGRAFPGLADRIHYLPKLSDGTKGPASYIGEFVTKDQTPAFVVSFADEQSPVIAHMSDIRRKGIRIWASPLWDELCAGHTDDRSQVDPDANWGWLIEKGANIICTDRPSELLDYLRRRNLHE
jgi:glycerophosphoryl diester phosphodiesterase